MRNINKINETKTRSISTSTPMDWRTYNSESKTSGHIVHIRMHLEDEIAKSTTTFKVNGTKYEAIKCTGEYTRIYTANGTAVNIADIPEHIIDSVNKAHELKQTDAQVTLDKMRGEYKTPAQQGSGEIKLKLQHGNVTTYSLIGPEIKIYKEVSKGTWTKLNAAINQILTDAQAEQHKPQCVSEGSINAVSKAKEAIDEINNPKRLAQNFNELEAAWNEISNNFNSELEAKRDEALAEKHAEAIMESEYINDLKTSYQNALNE